VTRLETLNYTVSKSHVLTEGIEEACELLIIARPLIDWLPYELEALAAYLAQGGQVFAALEPGMAPAFARSMGRYGLKVGDDVIVDVNPKNRLMGVDDSSFVVLTHDDVLAHPITQDLNGALVLGIARSITPHEVPRGLTATRILETSEDAWAETRIEDFPDVEPDGDELVGSVSVMVAVTVDDPAAIEVTEATTGAARTQDIRLRLMEWFGAQFNREVDTLDDSMRFREDLGAGDRDIEAVVGAVEELFGKQLLDEAPIESFKTIGDVARALTGETTDPFDFAAGLGRAVPEDFEAKAGGRLVVIGDADFAGNRLMEFGNNQDLFLNTVAWLAKEERQIGERPAEGDKLALTGFGEGLICLVSIVFVPGGAVFIAILLMVRRRYL
jgi:acyl carrier protein